MSRARLGAIAVLSSTAVLLGLAPDPVAADGNSNLHLFKFVDPVQLTIAPAFTASLNRDNPLAIPGDKVTYTVTVTDPTATFTMGGYFNAQSTASADATVAYYWDELEYCGSGFDCGNGVGNLHWTPVATFEKGLAGYVPIAQPRLHVGMTLAAQPVTRSGVTYPATGDPVIGTVIKPKATATWTYLARVTLSPAQLATLADPNKATYVRNVLHLEMTVRNQSAAQPATDPEIFTSPFTSTANPGGVHDITVTFTLPDRTTAVVDSSQVAALGVLSPGATATAKTSYTVPAPGLRGSGESESVYASRLGALDGAALLASAVASGTGFGGSVYATTPSVSTTENVPIVIIAKGGPANVNAGSTENNPLTLSNLGGVTASSLTVADTVPGGAHGTVTGVPASLAGGVSAPAAAAFAVPADQADGSLTDTASVTWQDAHANPYGSFTSSFTTVVRNPLVGGRITLAPGTAGPNPVGTTQTLTATLVDRDGAALTGRTVTLAVTGANATTLSATTGAGGAATFTYAGVHAGDDVAQATFVAGSVTLTSNTSSISWGTPLQPVTTSAVHGNFFANPSNSCTFDVGPGSTAVFAQDFPDILFDAPASAVPHDISNVNTFTRPFTDLTVDVNGNFNGQVVAQGNGAQAGLDSLTNFYAEFTGSFTVNAPGDLSFTVLHDDGYLLGVGGSATRVNGDFEGSPLATTPFNGYPVVAAFNGGVSGGSHSGVDTIHFPAAGTYPYELDYTECGAGELFLVLESAKFVAQTDPLSVYVGYADGLRAAGSIFPFPWNGSPNVIFVGCDINVDQNCRFDGGALRFDNSGTTDITFDSITVDIGPYHYDLWPQNMVLPAGRILIVTQTTETENFDTSDTPIACAPTGYIPAVHVTRGGVTTTFNDTAQILNTGGVDQAVCSGGNESRAWTRIGGGGSTINVPLPPGASLDISPFKVSGAVVGTEQKLTVAAMDGAGNPVANLPITLQVIGANSQQLGATTVSTGLATFRYVGRSAGLDSVQATAFLGGLREVSNVGSVTWVLPGGGGAGSGPPPPAITSPAPEDGTVVTKPVTVDATIVPPPGETITSWRVFYQALDPGPQVTFASGTGTPPDPLGTFDPTVLPNDTYAITVEATASNGGVQDVTTTVSVLGELKLGRYVTTYQDMSVPVNGFQMEVRRTYDSFDKSSGDFGVGWRVGLADFRVAPNRILGAGGWTMFDKQCFFGLCLVDYTNSAPRFVTVVFPDQHEEIFDFTPRGGTNVFWDCTPVFTARASSGTTSTLEAIDDTSCSYAGDGNLYGANGFYSPKRFRLTTLSGDVLVLDANTGLVSQTDRNGNSLNVDSTGVHASAGGSITYTRDGQGRIVALTGPSGQTVTYSYGASGDLVSSTDSTAATTSYTYDAAHNLTRAAGGRQPLQTFQYDTSGRLTSITDAAGNVTTVTDDVAGQKETVTDPLGRLTTVYTMDDLGDVVRIDRVAGGTTLTTTATYDAVGHPLTRTDPLGHTWTGTYDASGNLLSVTRPGGAATNLAYDSFGAPVSLRDPMGRQSTMAYDGSGDLITFTDAAGDVQHLTYDSAGNRSSITDGLGNRTTFTYDAAGHLTSTTDPLGHTTSFGFDSSGRLTRRTDALGRTTSYAYDAAGNVTSMTDGAGARWTYTFTAFGRLATATDPAGNVTTYAYDGNQRLISTTDPLGHVTAYAYDADGRLTSRTDPMGATSTYAYDGFGRLVSETDPDARVTSYAYDEAGRMVRKTMPNGGVYAYAYDALGDVTAVTDPLGRTTTSAYDAAGHVTTLTDGSGAAYQYSYDALGRTVSSVDPLGHETRSVYDAAGRLVTTTNALGAVTRYAYDAAGNLAATTDPLGAVIRYAYDADNRLIAITDPLGRVTTSAYDAVGRLTAVTLPSGSTTRYAYDPAGRLTSSTDGVGGVTGLTYDAAGRRTSTTDPNAHVTRFAYDAAGRQTSITDALGGVVTSRYDAAGELTSMTNAGGDTTTFTYDALGNVASQTDAGGHTTSFTYDASGELVSQSDPRSVTVNFAYDAAGRLTRTSFPGGSVTAAYDAAGERTSMVDATGTTRFAYDAVGDVTSVTAPEGAVTYAYDAAGRRTSMATPIRGSVGYTYDSAGETATMTDWSGGVFRFTYTADGQVASVAAPDGVSSAYGYDAADRLISISHGSIATFSYTLDADGNAVAATTAAGTEHYSLDALNRLVGVTYANGDTSSFTYDAAGNRLSRTDNGAATTYAYDSAGRLVRAGSTTFGYDAAGDMTSAGASSFSWDWAGRLASATVGGATTAYTYDGDGLRVGAQTAGSSVSYLWDRTAANARLIDDGARGYLHGAAGVLEQSAGGSSPATFPLGDGLGSIRDTVDPGGSVVGSADYDVFGSVRAHSGSTSLFGFTGEQTDPTGLVFLRSRYYDPVEGRFISPDSVQPNAPGTQGFNLYTYVANDPTTNTDPSGHDVGYVALSRVWPVILAGVMFAFRLALIAAFAVVLAALLEPAVEEAARDIDAEARAIFNRIMGDEEPEPEPSPTTCGSPGQECFPVPPLPTPTPQTRCKAGEDAVPGLQARAESIRAVELGTPAYNRRTVADLRVRRFSDGSCLDIIGSGADDLTGRQRTAVEQLTAPPAQWAVLSDRHAEITDLNAARSLGLPLAIGVTRDLCTEDSPRPDTCRLDITASGGVITADQRGAYWPANQA